MVSITNAAGWNMTWFDNLLNHFALYPTHLFALLFVIALSKSTVLVSSVLPPASVMLLAGITVSQTSLHPGLTWLGCRGGCHNRVGIELSYRPVDGPHAAGHALHLPARREIFAGTTSAAEKRRAGALYRAFPGGAALYRPAGSGHAQTERGEGVRGKPDFSRRMAALYVGIVTGISAF